MSLKNKTYLSVAIFTVIILIFVFLIIFPLLREVEKHAEELVFQKKVLVLQQDKTKNLEKFEKTYEEYRKNLDNIDKLFVNPDVPGDVIGFVDFLRKTATDSQVSLEIFSPSRKKKTENDVWSATVFQISAKGNFSNISAFLEKIETAPYLIEILDISIKKITEKEIKDGRRKENQNGDIYASFSISVFNKFDDDSGQQ